MKSILMSFSPYWYYLIGERIKKIECRKVKPKSKDWNGTIECYMTKDEKSFALIPDEFKEKYRKHFGKVGMRFVCDFIVDGKNSAQDWAYICEYSCVPCKELYEYCGEDENGDADYCYGLHISELKIHDTPRELSEFHRICNANVNSGKCWNCLDNGYQFVVNGQRCCKITCPPQSYYYIEE